MGERVFNITGPCVPLLYTGEEIPYQFNNPEIDLGTMYGILKEKEQKALEQLKTYLSIKQQKTGYLLSFCDNVKSPREDKKFEMDGYTIYETIVAYRDKA